MSDYSKLDAAEIVSLLFHPRPGDRNPAPENAQDIDIEVDDAILGCRFHHAAKEAPTILYFHGNGESTADYDDLARGYTSHGMNILITTYRGYGWSTGTPTATAMMQDAVVIFEKATEWLKENGYDEPIFTMGRSLGSAPALALTASTDEGIKGIIIESGFADTLPLAQTLGIDTTGLEESDCFGNRENIAEIELPTLILHGARDEIIPVMMGERLQADSGARAKQFMMIPGAGHNTIIEVAGERYFTTIKAFIDKTCGKTKWQYKRRRPRN